MHSRRGIFLQVNRRVRWSLDKSLLNKGVSMVLLRNVHCEIHKEVKSKLPRSRVGEAQPLSGPPCRYTRCQWRLDFHFSPWRSPSTLTWIFAVLFLERWQRNVVMYYRGQIRSLWDGNVFSSVWYCSRSHGTLAPTPPMKHLGAPLPHGPFQTCTPTRPRPVGVIWPSDWKAVLVSLLDLSYWTRMHSSIDAYRPQQWPCLGGV